MFNVTVQRAIEWYRASKNFTRILHDKENAVSLKTRQGYLDLNEREKTSVEKTNRPLEF